MRENHNGVERIVEILLKKLYRPTMNVKGIALWFGQVKKFLHIGNLVNIAERGVPVHVNGDGNLDT